MVTPVNIFSVAVERKFVFIHLKTKKDLSADTFQSVSYIQLKLVDKCINNTSFNLRTPPVLVHLPLSKE